MTAAKKIFFPYMYPPVPRVPIRNMSRKSYLLRIPSTLIQHSIPSCITHPSDSKYMCKRNMYQNTIHDMIFKSILPSFSLFSSSSSSSSNTRHRNEHWEQMFQELLEYRTVHGDCLVPAEYSIHPQLGTWVDTQRQQYRIYQSQSVPLQPVVQEQEEKGKHSDKKEEQEEEEEKKKKSHLTWSRIQLLESIGFVWDVHALKWEERYQELVQFQNKFGSVIVPKSKEYEILYNWVFTQRRQYTKWQQQQQLQYQQQYQDESIEMERPNDTSQQTSTENISSSSSSSSLCYSSLTPERIEKLNQLGFIWNVQDEIWMQKLQELRDYKKTFGNCLIPSNYAPNRSLAKWAEVQRKYYRERQLSSHASSSSSSSTSLTMKRIQLLEEEDFIWDVAEYNWNVRYLQVQEHVRIHGYFQLSFFFRKGVDNHCKNLGRWCQYQCREYEKWRLGKKTSMTSSRWERLLQLGFYGWNTTVPKRNKESDKENHPPIKSQRRKKKKTMEEIDHPRQNENLMTHSVHDHSSNSIHENSTPKQLLEHRM